MSNKTPSGFTPIALALSPDGSDKAKRYVFVKEHTSKSTTAQQDEFAGSILFACGLPFNFDHNDVTELFSPFGDVESVELEGRPLRLSRFDVVGEDRELTPSGVTARVYFADPTVAKSVCKRNLVKVPQPYQAGAIPCGVGAWLQSFREDRPDAVKLQAQVDKFMEVVDEREAQARKASTQTAVVDEEGFTLVTPSRKRPRLPADQKQTKPKKKAKGKEEVVHFYRFQVREQKKQELALLRKQFEEDKKTIARMREQRKFRPF